MTLLPGIFHKVPREGDSNTHLNVAVGLVPVARLARTRAPSAVVCC